MIMGRRQRLILSFELRCFEKHRPGQFYSGIAVVMRIGRPEFEDSIALAFGRKRIA